MAPKTIGKLLAATDLLAGITSPRAKSMGDSIYAISSSDLGGCSSIGSSLFSSMGLQLFLDPTISKFGIPFPHSDTSKDGAATG